MSLSEFDDSQWLRKKSSWQIGAEKNEMFPGFGWFRLHIFADTSIADRPVAFSVTHFGASEIYLDGILIKKFGVINGPDNSIYFDPQEIPFITILRGGGEHVIAVRYANYEAGRNAEKFKQNFAGFRLMIGETDLLIATKDQRTSMSTLVLMLLSGIFIALSLIHMFMYLYYRQVRSNLYFSLFMFSLASVFAILFVYGTSHSPSFELKSAYFMQPLYVAACIALSGFTNELFDKKKTRFKILVAVGIIALLMRLLNWNLYVIATTSLVISVSIEALITVVFAMIKRVKGAYIIGSGVLLFVVFILAMFVLAMSQGGNFDLNDSTVGGQILLLCMALSILSIPFSMSIYLAWNFSAVNKNLAIQLQQVQTLSKKSLEQEQEKQRILEGQKEELEREVWQRTAELREEKRKSDDLLLNILPVEVAEELKSKGSAEAQLFDSVTVLFTDFKGFTQLSEKLSPKELIAEINECFSAFDHIMQKHGVEKIKTIGDSYMAAGGLPRSNDTHATDVINAALEIQQFMLDHKRRKEAAGELFFEIRIGVHSGAVVAGIVGVKKFAYDIWGDAVNTASRMESSGEIGKINISLNTYNLIRDFFKCIPRGMIAAKGKGEVEMYFVESRIL